MPSHNWTTTASAKCRRCDAMRLGNHNGPFIYSLPDNLGSLDTRPPCNRASESRRTRKMGRRRKVLERSRAGGKRMISNKDLAHRAGRYERNAHAIAGDMLTKTLSPAQLEMVEAARMDIMAGGAVAPTYKLKITTSAVHAGPIARLVGDTLQITSVVDSAATWSVGEVKP